MRSTRFRWCIALTVAVGPQVASADEPLDLVPAQSLLCWKSRPIPNQAASDDSVSIATWIDFGSRLVGRPLQGDALLGLRTLEFLGRLTSYHHAIALIDTQARPLANGSSRKVDRLELALIVDAGGEFEWFRRTIQKVVNEQVTSSTATLVERRVGELKYQELHDKRLDKWAIVCWGEIGPFFVLTLGQDVWPKVAAVAGKQQPAITGDAWVSAVREQRGKKSLIEVLADMRGIRERLDPLVDGRATGFFKAWEADDTDRAHWAIGFDERAVSCAARFQKTGRDVERVYADPSFKSAAFTRTIPDQANYAIIRLPMRKFVPQLVSSLMATRSEFLRDDVVKHWERFQKEFDFNGQRDVLDHLGDFLIIHNDPPHPLRIPIAMTMLFEIKDAPDKVRETVEKICGAWQAALDKTRLNTDMANPLVVKRDDDGIWYIQIGLAGPAWTVTDRFIITSWSPAALRAYLEKVGDSVGRRTIK